jgi:hypothetical protein
VWCQPGGIWFLPDRPIRTFDSAWDEGSRLLRITKISPGTYDAFVWDMRSWTCGHALRLSVAAGGTATATVALVPGVRVRIEDLVGKSAVLKGLRLRAAGVEGLPATVFGPGSSSSYGEQETVSPDLVLAPLPFDAVFASFTGPDGKRREVEVRAPK